MNINNNGFGKPKVEAIRIRWRRQKRYKPGYVPEETRYLSFIYAVGLPAAGAAYPPAMDEQSSAAGVFGLATRRMCGLRSRLRSRWALTPPFHPYPP